MGKVLWLLRCIPGLSVLTLSGLLYLALWHDELPTFSSASVHSPSRLSSNPRLSPRSWSDEAHYAYREFTRQGESYFSARWILTIYAILVHLMSLAFPIRACWAIWQITEDLKSVHARSGKELIVEKARAISDDIAVDEYEAGHSSRNVVHAILLPNYKEDLDTLHETLDVLASHESAKADYDVYLAMEEAEADCKSKADNLIAMYSPLFRNCLATYHPRGIPDEAQGKSSNLKWAAKKASERHMQLHETRNTIVTVLDADTHLSSNYFSHITNLHWLHPDQARTTMYVPPIIFDRNAHCVPLLVRLADQLWCGAGLSGLYEGSSVMIPTSVYSLSMVLVDRVGGWDGGDEAIGEDMHMYLKCFFALGGHLTTQVIPSGASQTDVSSDASGLRGEMKGYQARYKQAIRHMWGALDTGFATQKSLELLWKGRPAKMNVERTSEHSAAESESIDWSRVTILLHRMFEAHFLPMHLMLLVAALSLFNILHRPDEIPSHLLLAINVTSWLRFLGYGLMSVFFVFYSRYHATCVNMRKEEMQRVGLYEGMKDGFTTRRGWWLWTDCVLFPIAGTIFGTIPGLIAIFNHFWTTSLVYRVSAKPMKQLIRRSDIPV